MNGVAMLSTGKNNMIETTNALWSYCINNNWAGYDPYDALNSRLFALTPFRHSQICRIAFIQIMKRLPINLRPFLLIEKEQNPKALALFLMSCIKLTKHGLLDQKDYVGTMIDNLVHLRSKNTPYWCWGYSFPWQTRTVLVPKGAPNLVCTVFVANALLDAYEANGDENCLRMATSAAEYLLDVLYWTEGDCDTGFCYPLPTSRSRVHNANFLGAALFCRVHTHTGENKFLGPALKVARYSVAKQYEDGSWDYGENLKQRWVDNFHTGYNLCALRTIGHHAKTSEFEFNIRRGFDFYRKHFFREDGAPRYFHNRTYPIDIHSVAQSIITLLELQDLDEGNIELAHSVYEWAINNVQDSQGHFYYQVHLYYKNIISYMRWSQAWMLLALATLLEEYEERPVN
jgi:hypothetical protein